MYLSLLLLIIGFSLFISRIYVTGIFFCAQGKHFFALQNEQPENTKWFWVGIFPGKAGRPPYKKEYTLKLKTLFPFKTKKRKKNSSVVTRRFYTISRSKCFSRLLFLITARKCLATLQIFISIQIPTLSEPHPLINDTWFLPYNHFPPKLLTFVWRFKFYHI